MLVVQALRAFEHELFTVNSWTAASRNHGTQSQTSTYRILIRQLINEGKCCFLVFIVSMNKLLGGRIDSGGSFHENLIICSVISRNLQISLISKNLTTEIMLQRETEFDINKSLQSNVLRIPDALFRVSEFKGY